MNLTKQQIEALRSADSRKSIVVVNREDLEALCDMALQVASGLVISIEHKLSDIQVFVDGKRTGPIFKLALVAQPVETGCSLDIEVPNHQVSAEYTAALNFLAGVQVRLVKS